ncbi:glycosyltransferase family 2 protein [Zooshikella ganghwensis]|uniref:Glycosyltransferase family 2 protein n=1 Tax=Zooshikella ganghwensis TaxID=202772 RepID=A0A4V1INB6_9GAMM|nr:glycosyltransferase family A protein [Zooshikella ganghwensis]RDH43161.1 glycosyltransferase family 2 protein [Zooshikella ganghwensis]
MSVSVSVIITTQNRPSYLNRALESVCNQTLIPDEVIVVDDHSDVKLNSEFFKDCDKLNLKYIYNDKIMGGNYSRNLGISHSGSDLIMFLDDDDAWLPTKISRQVSIFRSVCVPILVYTGKQFVDSESLDVTTRYSSESNNEVQSDKIFDKNFVGSTSGVAVPKFWLEEVGLFDESLPSLQDYDLWLRLSNYCRFLWDQEFNLKYTVHSKTGSQISSNVDRNIHGVYCILQKYLISNSYVSFRQYFRLCFKLSRGLLKASVKNRSVLQLFTAFTIFRFMIRRLKG